MKEKVEKCLKNICKQAQKAIANNNIEKAYTAIYTSADIQYQWNQTYTDDALESCIKQLVSKKRHLVTDYEPQENVILFYDGFGLDTRGLALIYLKALCDLNYSVVYVAKEKVRNRQPELHKVTANKRIAFHYLRQKKGDALTTELLQAFCKHQPQAAFFYTEPSDVEACVAFGVMTGKVRRYQINLTDHAFWLGRNAFDYCVEFREYGACVSHKYRHIPEDKIRLLSYYPYFDKNVPFDGFPFDVGNRQILFSGGSLYKTFDDKRTYYHMVEDIMQQHNDLLFLYAGTGDKSGLIDLQNKFPDRVFVIDERKDLYAVMQHITLYLNTYPMIGGLMTQYAAVAGKLPLTLVSNMDTSLDGLLLNHKELAVEFQDKEAVVAEANRLLSDEDYKRGKEEKIVKSVIDENRFREELGRLIEDGNTDFIFHLHDIDTSAFRESYMYRFSIDDLLRLVVNKYTVLLWCDYPKLVLYRLIRKVIRLFHK